MGRSTLFNFIAIIFLILALLWVVFVISRLLGPPATSLEAASIMIPTSFVLPTLTPTNTFTPTLTPTDTLTPTITPSETTTPSETPTPVPSVTITDTPAATLTPSSTPTPLATFTPQPSPTPTGPSPTSPPTVSPFPFKLREDAVIFTQNVINSAGCAWEGLGGQVFGLDGNPLPGLQIHVFSAEGDIDAIRQAGENSLYGPAGWEQPVSNTINNKTFFVQLLSPQGTVISERIQITFPSDCAQNLAIVNFIQTRPF